MKSKAEILKAVQAEYAQRQTAQEDKLYAHRQVLLHDQEYLNLLQKLRPLEIENAKKEALEKPDLKLTAQVKALQKQITAIEKKYPYSPAYLCKTCKDTGKLPDGARCTCFLQRVNDIIMTQSGIRREALHQFSEARFDIYDNPDDAKKLFDIVQTLAQDPSTTPKTIFTVVGASGVGKTFLLSCLAGTLLANSINTFFVSAFTLNNLFLKYHTTFDATRDTFLHPVFESEVLIIDDLGTEQILKNVTLEYLLEVLKTRDVAGKKTFIATNLMPDDLMNYYGERIASRILNKRSGFLAVLQDKNLRIKKGK